MPLAVTDGQCAHAMNQDGSVVARTRHHAPVNFVWTPHGGEYPDLPGPISGLSRDGDAYFGNESSFSSAFYVARGQAPVVLGNNTHAMSISADGEHVVGYAGQVPFHFSREAGFHALPVPPGARNTVAASVSPDGSMIVGYALTRLCRGAERPIRPVVCANTVTVSLGFRASGQ